MPNVQPVPSMNPIASQDPNYIAQLLKAQRAQKMAQALTDQGMAPIDYDHHGAISWTQGLSKALDAYMGKKSGQEADNLTAGAMTAGNQAVASRFDLGQNQPPAGRAQVPPGATGSSDVTGGGPQLSSSTDAIKQAIPATPGADPGTVGPDTGHVSPPSAPSGPALADALNRSTPAAAPQALADALNRKGAIDGGYTQGDPNNIVIPGMSKQQAYAAYLADPNAYVTELIKRSDNRTDLDKLLVQNGVRPGSQEWSKAHQDAVFKSTYVAPVEVKSGNVALDPRTNRPIIQVPKMDSGITADYTDPMKPTTSVLPGYADSVADIETANLKARNKQTLAPVPNQPVDDAGHVKNATVNDIVNPPAGAPTNFPSGYNGGSIGAANAESARILQQELQSAQQRGDKVTAANIQREMASRAQAGTTAPARPVGGSAFGQEKVATDNASVWDSQKQRAAQVPGTLSILSTMAPLLDTFTPGKGADNLTNWKSWAATHGISVDQKATDGAQEFNKYASQLIAQQRGAMGGTSTDASQAIAQAGSANWGIGKAPNQNIIQYLKANELGVNAFTNTKAAYLAQPGNGMHNASDFDNKWNSTYDPRIIMFQNMPPDQKAKFTAGLVKDGQYDDFERKLIGYKSLLRMYGQ